MLVGLLTLPTAADEKAPRVVVLAVDGLDPELCDRWIETGHLPQFARLAGEGTQTSLGTANPAQSPTSWATFLTGTGPGRSGVFGFVRRVPGTYEIETVLGREESIVHPDRDRYALLAGTATGIGLLLLQFAILSRWLHGSRSRRLLAALPLALLAGILARGFVLDRLPERIGDPIPPLTGTPFWEHASRAGRSTIVLGAPLTYPPREVPDCHLLCGFGTPDLRGTMGYWTLFTSAVYRERTSGSGGLLTPIQRSGRTETSIVGPDHPILRLRFEQKLEERDGLEGVERQEADGKIARLATSLPLRAELSISVEGNSIALETGSTSISLAPGEWSEWVRVDFRANRLITIPGMVRFRAIGVKPEAEVYMTPVQLDPRNLPARTSLSNPHRYAESLWERTAPFPTVGWPTATNALKDERIDEALFLETVKEEFESRRALTLSEVEREDWDLLVAFHYTPDRVSHMLWRHLDPASPRHDPTLAQRGQEAIREAYVRIDRLIGEIRERTSDRPTTLLVVSDHGSPLFPSRMARRKAQRVATPRPS